MFRLDLLVTTFCSVMLRSDRSRFHEPMIYHFAEGSAQETKLTIAQAPFSAEGFASTGGRRLLSNSTCLDSGKMLAIGALSGGGACSLGQLDCLGEIF